MIKTLTKHGNSLALIIEKPILDLPGIEADTPINIATDGQSLILTPVRDADRQTKFNAALGTVNRKYSKALKKLAE